MKTRYKILILLPMLLMLNSLIAEQQHISQGEMLAKVISVTFQFFVRVGLLAFIILFFKFVGEKSLYYLKIYYMEENERVTKK